ncbi:MAG TPA: thiamine diphosphokinase [Candidatus Limnocylindria bacterium]|nr:thiamine diphosphokinase [Candidatus Limnocylindria bacterium]
MVLALVVADGDVPSRADVDRLLGGAPQLVIAADGGALKAEAIGYPARVVVGDADSLAPAAVDRLRAAGAEVVIHPAAKDESDTELALNEALNRGATRVVVIGAFGGERLEHTLANILLIASEGLRGRDICLADGASTLRVMHNNESLEINGSVGDYVSLLPLTWHVSGVTTVGLRYTLTGDMLEQGPARGLSNELLTATATIQIDQGRLAVIHTRAIEVSDQ